jgi:TnpA family transposase
LLYHESDLRIEKHYTDTAGFTDPVFALMHLLGFRFAPRIRDLADERFYIHGTAKQYPTLAGLIGGSINIKHIRAHWDEIRRLAASIRQGTVTASLMLRKLGSYPRQNGLALALRELGRIERTLFALDWMQNVELRRRVHNGLNEGEAKNGVEIADGTVYETKLAYYLIGAQAKSAYLLFANGISPFLVHVLRNNCTPITSLTGPSRWVYQSLPVRQLWLSCKLGSGPTVIA